MVFREDPRTGNVRDDGSSGSDTYAPKKDFNNVSGLAKKAPKAKNPMPKQSDYPGDTRGWSEAVRKWRLSQDGDTSTAAQKKFLSK